MLELKALYEDEEPETALDAALEQIRSKGYAAKLAEAGAEPIQEIAAVFASKRVWVRSVSG